MGRCKDCKHWSQSQGMFTPGKREAICSSVQFRQYSYEQSNGNLARMDARGDGTIQVVLITHEQFGCIHFERMEEKKKPT